MADPFVGTWQLDPSTLRYEHGRPGRRARYVIAPLPDGLGFTLDGEDADGRPLSFTYGGALDGVEREIGGGAALALTRLDETSIESTLTREGRVVDRWVRVLHPDGSAITFTQYGTTPDGQPFRNVSVYRRVSAT